MTRIFTILTLFLICLALPDLAQAQTTPTLTVSQPEIVLDLNASTSLDLILEPNSTNVTGVDLLLNFDPTQIHITHITTLPQNPFPALVYTISQAASTATLKLTSSLTTTTPVTTSTSFVRLHLTAVGPKSSSLSFTCNPNTTTDTNIITDFTTDQLDCSSLPTVSITPTSLFDPITSPTPAPTPPTCPLPSSPKAITTTTTSSTSILATWPKPISDSYMLYYSTNSSYLTHGFLVPQSLNQFHFTNLEPNTNYTLAVASLDSCGTSPLTYTSAATSDPSQPSIEATAPKPEFSTTKLDLITSPQSLLPSASDPILLEPASIQDETAPSQKFAIPTTLVLVFLLTAPVLIYFSFRRFKA